MSDIELWELIKQDDYRAFTLLFKRYWLMLYKTGVHYSNSTELAEEIVHDVFVNIWKGRGHLKIEDVKGYLKAAVRYEVIRQVKKQKKIPVSYVETLPENGDSSVANKGYENLSLNDLEHELEEQLDLLPQRCKQIFLLSRKEHLSNAEIAEQLGISKRSVENQITAALKFLRAHIKNIAVYLLAFLLLK